MFKPIKGIQVTTLLLDLNVSSSYKLLMTGKFVVAKLPKRSWIIKIKVILKTGEKEQKGHLGYLGRDWFNLLCPGGCSASSSALLTTCSILIVRLAIIIRYSCCSIMPFFYGVCFFVWKFNWDQFNHCISFFWAKKVLLGSFRWVKPMPFMFEQSIAVS